MKNKDFFKRLTDICHGLLLNNKEVLGYLKGQRGMDSETIAKYNLGTFPKDLRNLYKCSDNMTAKELKEQNIIWNASRSQFQLFPIVIPVTDIHGATVAIGCRTLLDNERRKEIGIPKYRNSSYKKTSYLFGLDRAFKTIRQKDKVFVVEGYFDVITAHRKNIMNVVATCGTIFSQRQLIILSRYTDNICLLFDNDAAGRRSANNIVGKFKKFNDVDLTCKFTPPKYKDLDEYLMNGGNVNFFDDDIDLNNVTVKTLW